VHGQIALSGRLADIVGDTDAAYLALQT